ncbi:MAG: hypothetical protein ACRC2O_11785 [Chitinophagaceae bacterium]
MEEIVHLRIKKEYAAELIQQVSTASAIRYDQVRVKPVDTFPFAIHYTVKDSQIIILRVFNTYQRPVTS